MDSHRQMRITFEVNVNPFGQLIHNIFGSLRISLGRSRITFAGGFTKVPFFHINNYDGHIGSGFLIDINPLSNVVIANVIVSLLAFILRLIMDA